MTSSPQGPIKGESGRAGLLWARAVLFVSLAFTLCVFASGEPKHWAFVPVGEVTVPRVDDKAGWVRSPLDAFVLGRLEKNNLSPSGPARKEQLLRRVTLDLTGLPPTVDEMDAFLADTSTGAYDRVVDRLLASPRYGERMANDWLDVARYADTYGYQNDRESRVWPWRDWVIRAFNENLPYNDFIVWQIAGDLLPFASQDQRLATAFNRLHRQTNEGGSIDEEFRVEYVADRTRTFGTAFLGLTLNCARCHDHKFDPIRQKEYYEIFAFFNNIDESGMYSHYTDAVPSPSVLLYSGSERTEHKALRAAIRSHEEVLAQSKVSARERFEKWMAHEERDIPEAAPVVYLPLDTVVDGKTENVANTQVPASLELEPASVAGRVRGALEFSGDNAVKLAKAGRFDRFEPFSIALWLRTAPAHEKHLVVCHHTRAAEDAASRGYELLLENGKPTFSLCHFWPGNAIRVQTADAVNLNEWVHVAVTYDGSSRADGITIYVNGEAQRLEVIRDNLFKTILYADEPPFMLAQRSRDVGFKGGAIDEFMVFDVRLSALEVRGLAAAKEVAALVERKEKDAFNYYLRAVDPPYREDLENLAEARKAEAEFVEGLIEIMTMTEMKEVRQAYVLARGAYDEREERVGPDTPHSIMDFPEQLPRNRLGLAKWVVDPTNPLTARVAVNRFWQIFFGKGLVVTHEDFGTQGSPPSHPKLLEFLAGWFMDSGWNVKALCKFIVTSATYGQDSTPRRDLMIRDPENRLLGRGPRHRLSAEQIRDGALAASGLLAGKIGGPSVRPYQPDGLWKDASSITYTRDTGDSLYRRSMYTFWKRTVPPPTMMTFDATNREVCIGRRELTTTPLQALVLLNDPQFVEAARVLAAGSLAAYGDGSDEMISSIFRPLIGRWPESAELDLLRTIYGEQKELFVKDEKAAEAYVGIGDAPRVEGLDTVKLAAATALAQAMMNFDEFQVKQ